LKFGEISILRLCTLESIDPMTPGSPQQCGTLLPSISSQLTMGHNTALQNTVFSILCILCADFQLGDHHFD